MCVCLRMRLRFDACVCDAVGVPLHVVFPLIHVLVGAYVSLSVEVLA